MKISLRKSYAHVHVTYNDGDYSNNLNADNFTVDLNDDKVLFSMDFSRNESRRRKESNCYLDVQQLVRKAPQIKFLQISRDKWLEHLASALLTHPDAVRQVELLFKSSEAQIFEYNLTANEHSVFLYFVP